MTSFLRTPSDLGVSAHGKVLAEVSPMTTITPHFCWIYHGKGDDVRLAYVRSSVARGMVLCRIERLPGDSGDGFRRISCGPIRVLHKRASSIVRAATDLDAAEVERLRGLLRKAGVDLREAVSA